jgi:hypothetical protein
MVDVGHSFGSSTLARTNQCVTPGVSVVPALVTLTPTAHPYPATTTATDGDACPTYSHTGPGGANPDTYERARGGTD